MARRAPPNKGTGFDRAPPRAGRARPVGDLLPDVGGVAFRRFGFAQASLVTHWREIVGPVYAPWSVPEHLKFPRGQREGGLLTIRVEGPFASQMQHLEPQIIARANLLLGSDLVQRIRLIQGPVPRPQAGEPAPPAPGAPAATANLKGIADEELRAALERLAAALGSSKGPPRVR
ncbi:DUF721 domain-containing protein [Thermaurantiacus sp.]